MKIALRRSHDRIGDINAQVEDSLAGIRVVQSFTNEALLINCTAETVLRFLPPLVIDRVQIDEGIAILDEVLADEA
jgi:acetylornithine/succinyldiaminopimelate/putrescine aminotransferase